MAKNNNLHAAKAAKNDEFYTQRSDIENELGYYKKHFMGKTVYCNCDDPTWSEFWKFFMDNFKQWGLKRLISTHYDPAEPTYKLEYTSEEDDAGGVMTPLTGNGDFRSEECVALLKEADIVVTNPPFSIFQEYVDQLMEYKKKFLIIGKMNAIMHKDFFPLLKNDQVWLGYTRPKAFRTPDGGMQRFGNTLWFTNLDIQKRHGPLDLSRNRYYGHEKEYPRYCNYDGTEVSRTIKIPCDYDGVMGVPISFLDQYCPEQFEIVGMSASAHTMDKPVQLGEEFAKAYRDQGGTGHFTANMYGVYYFDEDGKARVPYGRIFIRRK